jgi:hypothetical protein
MTKTVDELMSMANAIASVRGNSKHAESLRAALRSALEAVVKDAERYDYLRLNGEPDSGLDEKAVDAAMQQAPEQEG